MIQSNSTTSRYMWHKFCKLITLAVILYSSSVMAAPPPLPGDNSLSTPTQPPPTILPNIILPPVNKNPVDNSDVTNFDKPDDNESFIDFGNTILPSVNDQPNADYPAQDNNSPALPLATPNETKPQKESAPSDAVLVPPPLPVDLPLPSSPALPAPKTIEVPKPVELQSSTPIPVKAAEEKPDNADDEAITIPVLPDESPSLQSVTPIIEPAVTPPDILITPMPVITPEKDMMPLATPISEPTEQMPEPLPPPMSTTTPIIPSTIETEPVPTALPTPQVHTSEPIPVPVLVVPEVIAEPTITPNTAPIEPSPAPLPDIDTSTKTIPTPVKLPIIKKDIKSKKIIETPKESAANFVEIDKFIKDETQMLLLPNDEIVLGILTDQAKDDQMDFGTLAKLVEKSQEKNTKGSQQQSIDNFIENYDKKFNEIKIPSKIIVNEAFEAVQKDDLFALRILVDNYPILAKRGDNNYTLLHATVEAGNYYLTKFLIIRGINLAAINSDYQTALMMANEESYNNISCILKKASSR